MARRDSLLAGTTMSLARSVRRVAMRDPRKLPTVRGTRARPRGENLGEGAGAEAAVLNQFSTRNAAQRWQDVADPRVTRVIFIGGVEGFWD
jgi:hypothetical protein